MSLEKNKRPFREEITVLNVKVHFAVELRGFPIVYEHACLDLCVEF